MCFLSRGRLRLSFIITWIKNRTHLSRTPDNYKGFTNFVLQLDTRHLNSAQMSALCDDRELAILFKGKHSLKAEREGVLYFFVSLYWLAIAYVALPNLRLTTET